LHLFSFILFFLFEFELFVLWEILHDLVFVEVTNCLVKNVEVHAENLRILENVALMFALALWFFVLAIAVVLLRLSIVLCFEYVQLGLVFGFLSAGFKVSSLDRLGSFIWVQCEILLQFF